MTPPAEVADGPVRDRGRAQVLDALRGFSLLGIFISHIPDFSGYAFMSPAERQTLDHFGVDRALSTLQDFLIRGKFYSLFSLLFGIGFAVQLGGADRRGVDFGRHFARRLAVLLLIGLAHAALWYGDILTAYALIGFLLIPMRATSPKATAAIAVFALVLRLAWPCLVALLFHPSPGSSGSDSDGGFGALTRAFAGGDPTAAFVANLELLRLKALQLVYEGRAISIFAMFALGALIGKLGLYRDLPRHRNLFRAVFLVCLPIGVVGNAVLTPLHARTPDFPPTTMWVLENSLYAVAVPAMALAYASGFAALWAEKPPAVLRWLAPVGRMALTTYVTQTVLGVALFYGIGLGLGGRIGLVEGTLLAVAIFTTQSVIAALWLRAFQFGPLEWVWRRATYGTPVAFRRLARVEGVRADRRS